MSNIEWVRDKIFNETNEQFRTAWGLYLKFYTVFMTANVAGIGLTVEFLSGVGRAPVIIAFVVQNVMSLLTAYYMTRFSSETSKRLESITRSQLTKDERNAHPNLLAAPTPEKMAVWSGRANVVSHVAMIGIWLALFFI